MTEGELRSALRDADPEQRRRAVAALAEEPPPDAAELLYDALGDVDWRVRKQAVRAVCALSPRLSFVPSLIEALCDGDNVGRRNAALEAIGQLGPDVVPPLVDALPTVPDTARKFLVDAMGDAGDASTVPVLVAAVEDDPDPNVAAAALDALARVGGPEAEAALRRRLTVKDPFQRMAALDGLARLGATVPWEELHPLLGDRLVRRVALVLLGKTGRVEAVDPLLEALSDPSPQLVAAAAVALERLHGGGGDPARAVEKGVLRLSPAARHAMGSLLGRGDLRGRQAAAHLLLLAQDVDALDGVVVLLAQDALPPAAVESLRAWGAHAVRPLLGVFHRADGWARSVALEVAADLLAEPQARGGAPDPEVQEALRGAIRGGTADSDPRVVAAAARSLIWWAQAQDAPSLVRLASRGPEEVARACGEALEALATSEPEAVREALEGVVFDGTAGAALAGVAARIGGPQTFERLQTALTADDPASRRAGIHALAAIGDRRSAEHIAYALTDEHVDVQTAAAHALGRMRDEQGQPLGTDQLLLALQSTSPAVQAAAASALGDAGEQGAIPPLRELPRSAAPGVAVAAIKALRRLHDPNLTELLVEALRHPDAEVVKQALEAIRETGGDQTVARLALGLEHESWDVRGLAVRLLGEVGGDGARQILRRHLGLETDAMIRAAIENALGAGEGR
jgi:HEAT repeat protein